jgi:hypothetical protein
LQTHQYDVCSQYKNEMSVHFSTDHINCLPQGEYTYNTIYAILSHEKKII